MLETFFYCAVSFGIGICFAAYFYERTVKQLEQELTYHQLEHINILR